MQFMPIPSPSKKTLFAVGLVRHNLNNAKGAGRKWNIQIFAGVCTEEPESVYLLSVMSASNLFAVVL